MYNMTKIYSLTIIGALIIVAEGRELQNRVELNIKSRTLLEKMELETRNK